LKNDKMAKMWIVSGPTCVGKSYFLWNKKDGLSSTKFRIVNRKDYQSKHEIIEVVI
tara:strand:- start:485 stop:652 length:168 start_codon:yes stop_codon:yes gene_type:complete